MSSLQESKVGSVSDHVLELRNKILVVVTIFLIGAVISHIFNKEITAFLLKPAGGQNLVFLSPLEPLFFILKIDFIGGLIFSFPAIIWAIFSYITPALPKKVGSIVVLFYTASTILLFAGLFYAFFVTIPLTLKFLFSINIPGIENSFSVQKYISFFITQAFIIMGVFQIPILIVGGDYLEIFRVENITRKRGSVYMILLVALAIITPTTDLFSLGIIFIPCVAIFEISILLAKVLARFRK